MSTLILFLVEESITNSFALFGAAALAAYIAGPFLVNAGAGLPLRVAVYTTLGVAAGLWSYSIGVGDRTMEAWEVVGMAIALAILAFPIIYAVAYFRSRRRATH